MSRKVYNSSIFELSKTGRIGYSLPNSEFKKEKYVINDKFKRTIDLDMPEVTELDCVRHFTQLSLKNFGVDQGFYPLGSCTMKYNPKVDEELAKLPSFLNVHPLQSEKTLQGSLEIYYELNKDLCSLTKMSSFTFAPCAGAHGELVGLMIIKAYFKSLGLTNRNKIIVPINAHGTNPASAAVCGFDVVTCNCLSDGCVDTDALANILDDTIAGVMLTNPSTLGIFEKDIKKISKLVHDNGSLMYYDGANLNAILGQVLTTSMGFDIMHINLHKTFGTPHGGGGPGSGPVGVVQKLVEFLPNPQIVKTSEGFKFKNSDKSIGRISSFYGNFTVCLKALCYIRTLGKEHIADVSRLAVLNANYIKESLKDYYKLPIHNICKHEVVFDGLINQKGTALDVAKRLLDYGYHPPTIYFPLLFHETLMIEPTENESLETLDDFIKAMITIANEDESILKTAPHNTIVKRLDEVRAARVPILKYKDIKKYELK